MPITPPVLDDRGYDDLVRDLVARIPAHTPEWTNPRPGDPGRTLIELFAWLGDALLYRANRIPDRQRLAFLRLVGDGLRPAVAARGMVSLQVDDKAFTRALTFRPGASLKAAVGFETRHEVTVLPVEARAYVKRPLSEEEQKPLQDVIEGLKSIYEITGVDAVPYATTPVFPGGSAVPAGLDLADDETTVDGALWLALFALDPAKVAEVRQTLGGEPEKMQRVLSVGLAPAVEVPERYDELGPRGAIPLVWEMATGRIGDNEVKYVALDVEADGTQGLTRRGVVRLVLPGVDDIGAPPDSVGENIRAGVGDIAPRLDLPKDAARLVTWVRVRPATPLSSLKVSWVGVNAVEVDGRETITGRVVGTSDGTPDQELPLGAQSIEADTLELQVEEDGGYQPWNRVDDLATAGRDDRAYQLDSEAGTVRFGDGVRGRIPALGRRVRVARMRVGGGAAGNLPAGSLARIAGSTVQPGPVPRMKVFQGLPTEGGEDAETLEQAERRIPAVFRHRDRAVTADDFRRLAAETPGVRLGRVEVLPRFKPQQRRRDVPGVVSVMILPQKEARVAPNPRPDRPTLEAVHAWLDARRPLATELYVIGCEYIPLGLTTSISIRDGWGRDEVVQAVRDAIRAHLWPLAPGGVGGTGWPLGQPVRDRELEVVVARVPGVATVAGVNVFGRRADGTAWDNLRLRPDATAELKLLDWQLPELQALVVVVNEPQAPPTLGGVPILGGSGGTGSGTGTGTGTGSGTPTTGAGGTGGRPGVAVPVVPEVC
ncbi:MAG TPA: putative baseplate assembly protein [Longimicrobium sp.]|nr:putative baseplate assembly protein [Longimicrobium sp.]